MFDFLSDTLQRAAFRPKAKPSGLPIYFPIVADHLEDTSARPSGPSTSSPNMNLANNETDQLSPADPLKSVKRHASPLSSSTWISRPSLSRFLADFTLGFADGLTVPFALTAGLSSLGQTDTVIYAGMAEICAGSISMGIGGYLSAKGGAREACEPTTTITAADVDVDEKIGRAVVVENYLAPLDLPSDLLDLVRQHVVQRSDITSVLFDKVETVKEDDNDYTDNVPPSSIVSGLSISAGYLIGGSLPLFPYFLVSHVGDGLMWSFVVCVIALFVFGFAKDFILHRSQDKDLVWVKDNCSKRWKEGMTFSWQDIRRSCWEGLLMVILGSMAALAAVLCVSLFEGISHQQQQV
ncbi:hypothetical protein VMCG_10008 [Cytospora schulzeri]|uniref:Uncharacterized protein n=1 Tax=Cytospora schulzeri TaxID=448051 RepID=A0A423VI07_9PEZI|nr:hypothetical protein VMCG_10008 [Valsa malicola]